jgi:hypothetical protein
MPATSVAFGLKALRHPSGFAKADAYTIASAYNTNLYQGTPVKIAADGTLVLAAVGDAFIGPFIGVEYTDTASGRRLYNRQWPANQAATDIVAYCYHDPDIIYEIQANGVINVSDIGSVASFAATPGSGTTTGFSTAQLDQATLDAGGTNQFQLQILNISRRIDNAAGDAFTIVEVRINKHQDQAWAVGH